MAKNNEIGELKNVLVDFINVQTKFNKEQKAFNEEQKVFNEEQREFNQKIDKKIDKVQYFLEETIVENSKIFFEEQVKIKTHVRELETEVSSLKDDMVDLASQIRVLQRV